MHILDHDISCAQKHTSGNITIVLQHDESCWFCVQRAALGALLQASEQGREKYLEPRHVIDVLQDFPAAHLDAQQLLAGLRPLQPRLYSISSSPLEDPSKVQVSTLAAFPPKSPGGRVWTHALLSLLKPCMMASPCLCVPRCKKQHGVSLYIQWCKGLKPVGGADFLCCLLTGCAISLDSLCLDMQRRTIDCECGCR